MSALTSALSRIIRSPDPRAEAERLLQAETDAKAEARTSRRAARKRRAKVLQLPGKSEADRAQEALMRMTRLAHIRVGLHEETNGTCAICGLPVQFARMHAHHILSGPERQLEERQETMAPCHERCHDWLHGKTAKLDQRDALVSLLAWCESTGRVEAAASTRRRIEKIDEARRAQG